MNYFLGRLIALGLLIAAAPVASAGLVLPIDNFTLGSADGIVFSQGGFSVQRTHSFDPGSGPFLPETTPTMKFNGSEGSFSFNGGRLTLTYTIVSNATATFASMYNALSPSGYNFDRVSAGVRNIVPPFSSTTVLPFEVLFNGGEAANIPLNPLNLSKTSEFEWLSSGNFNSMSFTFQRTGFQPHLSSSVSSNFLEIGGPGTPGMSAVPEPSALLLVGTLVGLAGVRRRFRS